MHENVLKHILQARQLLEWVTKTDHADRLTFFLRKVRSIYKLAI